MWKWKNPYTVINFCDKEKYCKSVTTKKSRAFILIKAHIAKKLMALNVVK